MLFTQIHHTLRLQLWGCHGNVLLYTSEGYCSSMAGEARGHMCTTPPKPLSKNSQQQGMSSEEVELESL